MKDLVTPEGRSGPTVHTPGGPGLKHATSFGAGLEPVLVDACHNRLSDVHWFRTDWQRGGAMTGFATYHDEHGHRQPAMIKLPVPPQELNWLRRLQPSEHDVGPVTPLLFAGGSELGGYDLAWVVMERLPHGPLDSAWGEAKWDLLIDALVRFYAAAGNVPVDRPPRTEKWAEILRKARAAVHDHELPEEQRWHKSLKALHKKLKKILKVWDKRDVKHWCHGDVHHANAMSRHPAPDGPALLFDLAEVHAGHWIEDVVYLEHLHWGRLDGIDPVKMTAQHRKQYNLAVDANWPLLADIRRILLAASAPAYLRNEGSRIHIMASLEILEQTLPKLSV